MRTAILSKTLVIALRIAAGHHLLITDIIPGEPFSLRCTQDSLIVHSAGEEPLLPEVEAADPLIAKAGFTVYRTTEAQPYVLIAPIGPEGESCQLFMELM